MGTKGHVLGTLFKRASNHINYLVIHPTTHASKRHFLETRICCLFSIPLASIRWTQCSYVAHRSKVCVYAYILSYGLNFFIQSLCLLSLHPTHPQYTMRRKFDKGTHICTLLYMRFAFLNLSPLLVSNVMSNCFIIYVALTCYRRCKGDDDRTAGC
jgi:hypothetical protein